MGDEGGGVGVERERCGAQGCSGEETGDLTGCDGAELGGQLHGGGSIESDGIEGLLGCEPHADAAEGGHEAHVAGW